jgi:chemosensory pili system protein ChpA (sensor histidine kinase/response regulator)
MAGLSGLGDDQVIQHQAGSVMAESKPIGGFKWVKGELIDNLRRVRWQLEAFLATRRQQDLGDAVTALYEVRAVLSALQMTAPARLAEEMQRLVERLTAGEVPNWDEAAEAMVLAHAQLSHHLERAGAGLTDPPAALLPAINDLRICRLSQPLKLAELLIPSSVLAELETPTPEALAALASVVAKVRPHFHRYLLQALQGEGDQGLVGLGQLFNQLHRFFKDGVFCDAFRAAEALVGGVLDGGIPMTAATRALLGRIDTVFKSVLGPEPTWPEPQAHSLTVELVAFLADRDPESPLVTELGAEFGVHTGVAGRSDRGDAGQSPKVGSAMMAGLVGEVLRELAVIKERLDLLARGGGEGTEVLAPIETALHQLATALAIGDDRDLVGRLRAMASAVGAAAKGQTRADEAFLTGLAQDLLAAEAGVRRLKSACEGEANGTEAPPDVMLIEARRELGKARQAITEAPHRSGPTRFADVDAALHRVAVALHGLAEEGAADLISGISDVLRRRFIEGGEVPDPGELDLLGEAISGVDLHLEGLAQGAHLADRVLSHARASLEVLAGTRPAHSNSWDAVPLREPPPVQRIPASPIDTPRPVDAGLLEIFSDNARAEQARIAAGLAFVVSRPASHSATTAPESAPVSADIAARLVTGCPPGSAARPATGEQSGWSATAQVSGPAPSFDQLVADASEIGICHARIAKNDGAMGLALTELDQTVAHLRERLHQLDAEMKRRSPSCDHRGGPANPLAAGDLDLAASDEPPIPERPPEGLLRGISQHIDDLARLQTLLAAIQHESADLLARQAPIGGDA